MGWYEALAKPSWAPQPMVFGMVWSVLYPVIFLAFGYVVVRVAQGQMPAALLLPIGLNLAANFAFTPIQFGMRDLALASADILLVLATTVWCIAAIWPHAPVAAVALVPYLVWVTIATVLQLSIAWMNP